jgi:hypothetical protein
VNLNNHPTPEELRDLIRGHDDLAGHHVLWVRKNGEVVVSLIPRDQTPVGFQAPPPDMQMQFEPFLAGNEYVGPEAAADEEWVNDLFDRLREEWSRTQGKPEVAYVGGF